MVSAKILSPVTLKRIANLQIFLEGHIPEIQWSAFFLVNLPSRNWQKHEREKSTQSTESWQGLWSQDPQWDM